MAFYRSGIRCLVSCNFTRGSSSAQLQLGEGKRPRLPLAVLLANKDLGHRSPESRQMERHIGDRTHVIELFEHSRMNRCYRISYP